MPRHLFNFVFPAEGAILLRRATLIRERCLFQIGVTHGGNYWCIRPALRVTHKRLGIDTNAWEELVCDRIAWRNTVHRAVVYYKKRTSNAITKRRWRKAREKFLTFTEQTLKCTFCPRSFHARIGHLCTHKWLGMSNAYLCLKERTITH